MLSRDVLRTMDREDYRHRRRRKIGNAIASVLSNALLIFYISSHYTFAFNKYTTKHCFNASKALHAHKAHIKHITALFSKVRESSLEVVERNNKCNVVVRSSGVSRKYWPLKAVFVLDRRETVNENMKFVW